MAENKEFTKYSIEDYNKAMELHAQGYGNQRIAKFLGYKSRGAIEDWINKGRMPYYHSKKRINWSRSKENVKRIQELNKKTQPKAVKISAEQRTKRLPKEAKELSSNLGYVLGVCYGDGHISIKQRRVMLSAVDKDFVQTFKGAIEEWSGFNARLVSRDIKKPEKLQMKTGNFAN